MSRSVQGKQKQKQRKERRAGGKRRRPEVKRRGRGPVESTGPAPLALLVRGGRLHGASFPSTAQNPADLGWERMPMLPEIAAAFKKAGVAVLEAAVDPDVGVPNSRWLDWYHLMWVPTSVMESIWSHNRNTPPPAVEPGECIPPIWYSWLADTLAATGYTAEFGASEPDPFVV